MNVLNGLTALDAAPQPARSAAVIVGVFDGVHLGHQRLLHELLEFAAELDADPTVVTFQNHPEEVLGVAARDREASASDPAGANGADALFEWLVSVPHRLRLLRRAGVHRVLLLEFDENLRSMTARGFSERILKGLSTRGMLVGYDSAIGRDREGDAARMRELGAELGFEVREGTLFEVDGRPVSSTAIREAIRSGDLAGAARLLGRWPSAFGRVVRGAARGKSLGFPTANVVPQSLIVPPSGVYAVEVLHDGEPYPAVANLGSRPTFADAEAEPAPPGLEVHLLDFDGDLYGHHLEVTFHRRLRDERRFDDVEKLKAQIRTDVAQAREVLAS